MPVINNIDRLATSRTDLRELTLPPTIDLPIAAVVGSPEQRRAVINEFNRKVAERDKLVAERILSWLRITSDT